MGAWSHESFGNDDASDWITRLEEQEDLKFVDTTLDALLAIGDDYIEAPEACEAIAAAEVVARAKGHFGTRGPDSEEVDDWVERVRPQPSAALVRKASRAIDRILTEPSELLELWEESDDAQAWQAAMKDLKARVDG